MPKNKRVILQPAYLSRFRCIGGACEDSCCVGNWNIYVDKKTFLKYRDVGNAELQPVIDDAVKRYRGDDASDAQYGRFRMRRDGKGCVFLTDNKLCRLVEKLGPDSLCDVCAIYPRLYKIADGKIERSATFSCPEIARLALFDPEGIVFEKVEEGGSVGRIPPRAPSITSTATEYAARPGRYLWDIRMACLSILQNREYTMGQRMIILGMFCKKIDELDRDGRVDEIPAMLEKFGAGIEDESFKKGLEDVGNNFEIQMRLAKELTDKRLETDLVGNTAYIECVKETFVGLDFVVGSSMEKVVKKFAANRDDYIAEYLKNREYVLENFLVNEFFTRMMPFAHGDATWDSYLFLCVMYGMVKLHLNGMAGCRRGLTDEMVFKLIQSFAKVVLHNGKFIPDMMKTLKDNGFDTLGWMTILVND